MADTTVQRLPDGSTTSERDEYVKAWLAIGTPAANAIGGHVWAFDPDIVVIRESGERISLPLWAAKEIRGLAEELSVERAALAEASGHAVELDSEAKMWKERADRFEACLRELARRFGELGMDGARSIVMAALVGELEVEP